MAKASTNARIGKAAEYLVAASVMLGTDGEVNVSTSLVDDEGVDLIFHRRDGNATVAVQVKTRTTETTQHRGRGWIQANVRSATLREHHDFAVLVALVVYTERPGGVTERS